MLFSRVQESVAVDEAGHRFSGEVVAEVRSRLAAIRHARKARAKLAEPLFGALFAQAGPATKEALASLSRAARAEVDRLIAEKLTPVAGITPENLALLEHMFARSGTDEGRRLDTFRSMIPALLDDAGAVSTLGLRLRFGTAAAADNSSKIVSSAFNATAAADKGGNLTADAAAAAGKLGIILSCYEDDDYNTAQVQFLASYTPSDPRLSVRFIPWLQTVTWTGVAGSHGGPTAHSDGYLINSLTGYDASGHPVNPQRLEVQLWSVGSSGLNDTQQVTNHGQYFSQALTGTGAVRYTFITTLLVSLDSGSGFLGAGSYSTGNVQAMMPYILLSEFSG